MKHIVLSLRLIASLALAALMVACASTTDSYANVDPAADFSSYKTYGFVDSPASNSQDYESLETSFLKVAVAQQMDARGYHYAKEPDLLLNFYIHTKEKSQTYSTPVAHGYCGYRDYNSWGGVQQ